MADVTTLIRHGIPALFSIAFKLTKADVVYCWFGTVYSALAVLAARFVRIPSIVVLGGFDVANLPEIEYGIWRTRWKAWLLKRAYPRATLLLAVSPTFREEVKRLAGYDAENVRFLPTGFDGEFWKPGTQKKKTVLTVAHASLGMRPREIRVRLKTKGIDYLLEAARRLPDVPFRIVGVGKEVFESMQWAVPENVELLPVMTQELLRAEFQATGVYCQPSRSEGIPNALCEAMLCGCVPVGSTAGGIPTAIGETGYLVPAGDVEALVSAIGEALVTGPEKGKAVREKILSGFSRTQRENAIREILDSLK